MLPLCFLRFLYLSMLEFYIVVWLLMSLAVVASLIDRGSVSVCSILNLVFCSLCLRSSVSNFSLLNAFLALADRVLCFSISISLVLNCFSSAVWNGCVKLILI